MVESDPARIGDRQAISRWQFSPLTPDEQAGTGTRQIAGALEAIRTAGLPNCYYTDSEYILQGPSRRPVRSADAGWCCAFLAWHATTGTSINSPCDFARQKRPHFPLDRPPRRVRPPALHGLCRRDVFEGGGGRAWPYPDLIAPVEPGGDGRPPFRLGGFLFLGEFNISFVVDDRPKVCDMWRRKGLTVLHCADPSTTL